MSKIMNKNVLQSQFDKTYIEEDGVSKLQNVKFKKDEKNVVHVTDFETLYSYTNQDLINYPMSNGSKIRNPNRSKQAKTLLFL